MNRYIYTLDWVRAFAILTVLFSHWSVIFQWKDHPYFGWLDKVNEWMLSFLQVPATMHPGVITFIVLSGFVIHYPNAVKLKKDKEYLINIRKFFARRFFRIFPVLAVIMFLSVLIFDNNNIAYGLLDMAKSLSLVYAVYPVQPPLHNAALVTVIVEMVLYFQYLLVYRILNFKIYGLIVWAVISILLSMLFYDYFDDAPGYWKFHNLVSFTPFWVIGALAAHVLVFKHELIGKYIDLSLCIMTFLVWVFVKSLYLGGNAYIDKLGFLFFAFVVSLFILYLSISEKLNSSGVIDSTLSRVLIWVGTITYSIYLIHTPVLHGLELFFQKVNIPMVPTTHILLLMATFLIAHFFYVLVERPFHAFARKF